MSEHHELTTPILEQLRDLFSEEGTFIEHGELSPYHWAQAEDGDWVRPDSPRAVRWTLEAAVVKLTGLQQVEFLPAAVNLDQVSMKRYLSKMVSDRLMAVNYQNDGHANLRAHNNAEGREGVLELIEKALGFSSEDVRAAHEAVQRNDPPPVEPQHVMAMEPEPEPPPVLEDVIWDRSMGKRLPDGDYELEVPFDGEYRVQPVVLAINGKDLAAPPEDGVYVFSAKDVLTTDDIGHLFLLEEREPREVGRWFQYKRDRQLGVQMRERLDENARDRQ